MGLTHQEPVPLDVVSKIGFGTYRLTECDEHFQALQYALENGSNLIDTASNYTQGQSERLVGKVLTANPHLPAFIVTKAGYINLSNAEAMDKLRAQGMVKDDTVMVDGNPFYSMNPHFIHSQIVASLARLGRGFIDVFLLHNPEHYFRMNREVSEAEFLTKVHDVFCLLEEQAEKGNIRYYGVSSNMLPNLTGVSKTVSLLKLIEVANNVSANNRFRFIQFPYNLFEDQATETQGRESLVSLAKTHGIKTIGNRPLNANAPDGPFRIATYNGGNRSNYSEDFESMFNDFIVTVSQALSLHQINCEATDIPVLKLIRQNWKKFSTPDAVHSFFQNHVQTFVGKLYQGDVPDSVEKQINSIRELIIKQTKLNVTLKSESLRSQLIGEGRVRINDNRPLSTVVCELYLDKGLDHVLVGMRQPEYVDDLKSLFTPPSYSQ